MDRKYTNDLIIIGFVPFEKIGEIEKMWKFIKGPDANVIDNSFTVVKEELCGIVTEPLAKRLHH